MFATLIEVAPWEYPLVQLVINDGVCCPPPLILMDAQPFPPLNFNIVFVGPEPRNVTAERLIRIGRVTLYVPGPSFTTWLGGQFAMAALI